MVYRVATWAFWIWTVFMAVGILAASLGIGDDCTGTGTALSDCQADAWSRGIIGLGLLVILWLVVAGALWIVRRASRPKLDEPLVS